MGRKRCPVPVTVCFYNVPQIPSQQGSDLDVWLFAPFLTLPRPLETSVGLDLFSPTCLLSPSKMRLKGNGFLRVLMDFPWATQEVIDQRKNASLLSVSSGRD